MENYKFTETDLYIQTLYSVWLKENRKVIDIEDLASFNTIMKEIAEDNNVKISYYQKRDNERRVEEYFRQDNRKYILFPWYTMDDIEYEIPDIVSYNIDEIIANIPPKDETTKQEYKELYESLEPQLKERLNIIKTNFGKK